MRVKRILLAAGWGPEEVSRDQGSQEEAMEYTHRGCTAGWRGGKLLAVSGGERGRGLSLMGACGWETQRSQG